MMTFAVVFLIFFKYTVLAQNLCNVKNNIIVCEGTNKTMTNEFFKTLINTENITEILIENITFTEFKLDGNESIFDNVKSINLHNNELKKISLVPDMFPNLLCLNASNNKLIEIPNLSNFTNLQYIDLRHNIISDYKLIKKISSKELYLEDNLPDCDTNFTELCSSLEYIIDICNETLIDNEIYCKVSIQHKMKMLIQYKIKIYTQ